jgi:hypothetical protein
VLTIRLGGIQALEDLIMACLCTPCLTGGVFFCAVSTLTYVARWVLSSVPSPGQLAPCSLGLYVWQQPSYEFGQVVICSPCAAWCRIMFAYSRDRAVPLAWLWVKV